MTLKPIALALAIGLFGAGSALAASCCDEKGKPCCEEKDGKRAACCDKHKDHGGKPDAPKPADQPKPHSH
jgi:hypothetical protein